MRLLMAKDVKVVPTASSADMECKRMSNNLRFMLTNFCGRLLKFLRIL